MKEQSAGLHYGLRGDALAVVESRTIRSLSDYVASLRLGINIPHLSGFLDVAFRPSRGGAPRAQSGSLVLWFSFRVESRAANREEQG